MAFVEVRALVKSYTGPGGRLEVLRGLELDIDQGQMLAIVGASGVGKSTLLHVIGGLDALDGGSVRIGDAAIDQMDDEARVKFRNQHVGFVFQFHHLLPEFTAVENVAMPLFIAGRPAAEARTRAEELLRRVGLAHRFDHRPGALSGGEQQRVAVARALVCRPSVLLADEPTGNLDSRTSAEIMALLAALNRDRGITIVIVTHDLEVARHARRRVVFRDGHIVSDTSS
jgi:lipoprotein-releasing system ATP-binding protein